MSDVRIVWKDMAGDIALDGVDLAQDDGLETAVIMSLFTDRRAEADDILPGAQDDRRGWWGDSLSDIPGDKIGSRRWLLSREKLLPSVVNRLIEYDREALQWLVDDGVALAFDVAAEIERPDRIKETIRIRRPSQPAVEFRFSSLWRAI